MADARTTRPFTDELPRLLRERGISLRALAEEVGVSDSHLSRVLRRADYKRASTELMTRIAKALDLPSDYFAEVREAFVVDRVRSDRKLRDELYDRLRRGGSRRSGS
jgi:transcriptional regulator with XRE-family HTH domain